MLKSVPQRSFVTAALWILLLTTGAALENPDCTFYFTFSDLNSTTLTAEINANISVAFRLETKIEDCDIPENFEITVRKKEKREFQYVCKLLHINGRCNTSVEQRTCKCLPEDGRYQLSIRAEENDHTTWAFSTNPDISREAIINVTSPSGKPKTTVPAKKTSEVNGETDEKNKRMSRTRPALVRTTVQPTERLDDEKRDEVTVDAGTRHADFDPYTTDATEAVTVDEPPNTDIYLAMLGMAFIIAASLAVGVFVYYRFCKGKDDRKARFSSNVSKTVQGLTGLPKRAGARTSRYQSSLMRRLSSRTGRRTESQAQSDAPSVHIYWELEDEPGTNAMVVPGELVEEGDDVVMIVNTLYQGQQSVSRVASLAGNEYEEIAVPAQAVAMDYSSRPPALVPKHAPSSLTKKGLTRKLASLPRRPSAKHGAPQQKTAPKPGAANGDYVTVDDMEKLNRRGEETVKKETDADEPGAGPGDYVSLNEALQMNKQDK